jgi:hypothetical protein
MNDGGIPADICKPAASGIAKTLKLQHFYLSSGSARRCASTLAQALQYDGNASCVSGWSNSLQAQRDL